MNDFEKKKDEDLIPHILDNPDLLELIIIRYKKKLRIYIQRISSIPADDVDDLLQDVFLSVYQNLNSFKKDFSFSAWIYRIAHNKAINFWKKHKEAMGQLNIDDNLFLVESIFSENTVEKDLQDIENTEMVGKIFMEMKDKDKNILILKFLEGKDYKEISDILQQPMGTVATNISRAKAKFRKKFQEYEDGK